MHIDETEPSTPGAPPASAPVPHSSGLPGRIENPSTTASALPSSAPAGRHVPDGVKPKLRGWLHAGMAAGSARRRRRAAAARAGGRPAADRRLPGDRAAAVRRQRRLPPRSRGARASSGVLKRLDHANIFLIIAGSYTPFAVLLLDPGPARRAALGGLGRRARRRRVPGALGGCAALAVRPGVRRAGLGRGVLPAGLPAHRRRRRARAASSVGGVLYTVGGVVYGLKRPNPSPRWFGFHEVFHALTLAGLRGAVRRPSCWSSATR